jgi:hypothetical protein
MTGYARPVRILRLTTVVLASSALLFVAPRAAAAPLTDRQVAQSLFEQARELMAKNDYAKACPMLSESQRLDPGGGTLLNLALCYEGEGKLATAQLELNDALSQAVKDGRADRETIAREHLAALGARVPKLTLVAPAQPVPGLVIELDGITMSSATSGVALPVDPGSHEVRASAPGYVPWSATPKLREGESRRLALPDLVKVGVVARPSPLAPAPTPEPAPSGSPTRFATASWVFAGVGIGALTASVVTGVIALNTRSDFEKRCFPERSFCSNPTDADLALAARNLAWVSTGLLVVALAAGTAAWFWPRTTTEAPARSAAASRFPFEF